VADAKRLSRLLGIGVRTIRSMDAAGKLPKPTRLNTRVVWIIREIRQWLEAGAPDRAEWEALKKCKRR
jgi:predicted DNA-binding transcriptional regulator AlpA